MTYTTSPIVLTDAIERIARARWRNCISPHELAMMMTIALRFIPTLIEETENHERPEGPWCHAGQRHSPPSASRRWFPILIPLVHLGVPPRGRAGHGYECRCYHGGEGRTRLKQLKFTSEDFRRLVVITVALVVIACNTVVCAGVGVRFSVPRRRPDNPGLQPRKYLLFYRPAGHTRPLHSSYYELSTWISYKGTRYAGFQVQPNAPTVCAVLQDAMGGAGPAARCKGCSRTDSGVHARRFALSFCYTGKVPMAKLVPALNAHLPPDIRAVDIQPVPDDFHARYAAHAKTYHYYIF